MAFHWFRSKVFNNTFHPPQHKSESVYWQSACKFSLSDWDLMLETPDGLAPGG